MKIISFLTETEPAGRILQHTGEPQEWDVTGVEPL